MNQLTDRQKQLFSAIVDEYVSTARPIASGALAKAYGLDVSPATVRNDMAILEDQGLIQQPHTSAGRIPTERGYQYYVETFVSEAGLSSAQLKKLNSALDAEVEATVKHLAKTAADLSMEAVFMSIKTEYTFYTGISNVLKQPEFMDRNLLLSVGSVVDSLDEVVSSMIGKVTQNVEVMIGRHNPFSPELSVIMTEYETKKGETGLIGLLGPMRMEYKQNIAVVKSVQKILNTYEQ